MKIVSLVTFGGVLFLMMLLNMSHAQAQAQSTAAPSDATATRLPGDNPMIFGAPRPPAGGGARRPPAGPGRGPSLALAIEGAQAAIDACAADGHKVGASVIDSTGQPRASLSGDGATGSHIYTGVRKALTALTFKEPSSQVATQAAADPTVASRITPNMAVVPGAVPLMAGDEVIGAIGVSGASSEQDEACAVAGANKIKDRLK